MWSSSALKCAIHWSRAGVTEVVKAEALRSLNRIISKDNVWAMNICWFTCLEIDKRGTFSEWKRHIIIQVTEINSDHVLQEYLGTKQVGIGPRSCKDSCSGQATWRKGLPWAAQKRNINLQADCTSFDNTISVSSE